MKNIITTIFQTAFTTHPALTLLVIFTVLISLLFLTVFIFIKSGSITMCIDFKNKKIELNIAKQNTSSIQ